MIKSSGYLLWWTQVSCVRYCQLVINCRSTATSLLNLFAFTQHTVEIYFWRPHIQCSWVEVGWFSHVMHRKTSYAFNLLHDGTHNLLWHVMYLAYVPSFFYRLYSLNFLNTGCLKQVSNTIISFIIECTFFYTLHYIMTASNVRAKLNKANIPATISVHSTPHFLKALGQRAGR